MLLSWIRSQNAEVQDISFVRSAKLSRTVEMGGSLHAFLLSEFPSYGYSDDGYRVPLVETEATPMFVSGLSGEMSVSSG